jgi:hypothetical protein
MEEILKDLKTSLTAQLEQAASEIKEYEQKLMHAKEHFLKVAGALEYHSVLEQKYKEQEEAVGLTLVE